MITKEQIENLKEGDVVYYIETDDQDLTHLHCCKIVSFEECRKFEADLLSHSVSTDFLLFSSLRREKDWFLTPQEGFTEIEKIGGIVKQKMLKNATKKD